MPRKKIVDEVLDNAPEPVAEAPIVEETPVVVAEEVVVEVISPAKKGDSVSVYDTNGNFIREYSKEVHGKDFSDLAKQFAAKKGYSLA